MVQGQKLRKKVSNTNITLAKAKKASKTKRGARAIAPKKQNAIVQAKLSRKLTAVVNNKVEKNFATKANSVGRLTMMKGVAEKNIKDVLGDKKLAPSAAGTTAAKTISKK